MKRALTIVALAAAIVMALAVPATAFAANTITGTVKDISTGKAISGVTVSNGTNSAVTNSSGVYTITTTVTGVNTLSATASTYQKTWRVCTPVSGGSVTVNWSLTKSEPTGKVPARGSVSVLAWNDLGMHCDQDSYKYACILPPYNTLHAQIFEPNVDPAKYTVTYSFAKKTDPTLHTDFWTYCSNFGWTLAKGVGLSGNKVSGSMKLDSKNLGFVADGIPVTPYDDDGTWDPYGQATLVVKEGTTVRATTNVVVPVSTEMSCNNSGCHSGTNYIVDVLTKHDSLNGTTLLADANAGKPHRCSECHSDNAVSAPGKSGVESLSYAMHNRHGSKIQAGSAGCMNCHPGPKTQCFRGIHFRAGLQCPDCHGPATQVASSQLAPTNRQPWLQEPKCGSCHDSKHQENANTLYRNSILTNSCDSNMNNKFWCEACHNGTHAEYTTANSADAVVTQTYQGNNYWIYNCQVCHTGSDQPFNGQAMHK